MLSECTGTRVWSDKAEDDGTFFDGEQNGLWLGDDFLDDGGGYDYGPEYSLRFPV